MRRQPPWSCGIDSTGARLNGTFTAVAFPRRAGPGRAASQRHRDRARADARGGTRRPGAMARGQHATRAGGRTASGPRRGRSGLDRRGRGDRRARRPRAVPQGPGRRRAGADQRRGRARRRRGPTPLRPASGRALVRCARRHPARSPARATAAAGQARRLRPTWLIQSAPGAPAELGDVGLRTGASSGHLKGDSAAARPPWTTRTRHRGPETTMRRLLVPFAGPVRRSGTASTSDGSSRVLARR